MAVVETLDIEASSFKIDGDIFGERFQVGEDRTELLAFTGIGKGKLHFFKWVGYL